MLQIRNHLTFANVVSVLALFIAIGGSAYAAAKINGETIVDRSVSGKKIEKDALGNSEIKESKLKNVRSAITSNKTLQLSVSGSDDKSLRSAVKTLAGESEDTLVKLSVGETETLISKGPFSYVASCISKDGAPRVRVVAKSTEAGSIISYLGGQTFGPGTEVSMQTDEGPSFGPTFQFSIPVVAAAPSGATLQIPGVVIGTQNLGADCVASTYGVG